MWSYALQPDFLARGEIDGREPHLPSEFHDFDNTGADRFRPQSGDIDQRQCGVGQWSVAVGPLGDNVVHLFVGGGCGQPAVGLDAGELILDVSVREMCVDRQIDSDLRFAGLVYRRSLELSHCLRHQLGVQVETDRTYVPRLHLAEHRSGSADLEVAEGQVETAAEVGVLADGFETAIGILGERLLGRVEEVGIGALTRPTDPSPELVQLCEAEQIRPLDDERVDLRQIQTGLDDGGGHQNVVFAAPEVEHHLLELAFGHLTVGNRAPGVGDQLPDPCHRPVDRLHSIVYVEHLPLPQHLPADRRRNCLLIEGPHVGEDRMAIFRSSSNVAHVADSGQGHLESSRDWCGGQREHVYPYAEPLDLILRLDSETLLLVDDEQSQILELDVL